ncbi:putative RNA binding protein YcfA (HicA-like mRNA interferase family) [Parabacteroides sp. PF5-5]|uniref:type II toxin-antitoxin system HicA family toxin n=1 Tax=unclassified Parabacteroides TaxID=2649774 RepID=UPI0024759991|nr:MULTISPECIES: type II toxin-antitoxin system HicA family toxin [unclassified Parabacteroides]MDH6305094.1 putative RNA binding protein YcfA (HicA-like mRNA interferase family) [Parabacteroides sp. PH5-39]MDH6316444.1 putative RNA binding protein YcfA (HicA-like mRNA interferase family) [Parabacteroides sp. PF5-13]MDH6319954.1 putative RNA binding protein YcfA (HicA-like mRNA interferase family) [Parabacteroides sp. PH5-13]MDH6323813.1 putative RNA binding protein YcfA (HicA-like mRNA interfe
MSYKSVKEVVALLIKNGFELKSQRGSHLKYEKNGLMVIVPNHGKKGIEKGTYYNILRQAGLK